MEVFVSYDEMHEYVGSHYNKEVLFAKAGEQAVRITLVQSLKIFDTKVSEKLHIDEVTKDSVTVSYKGGFMKDMVISAAIGYIRGKNADLNAAIITEDGNRVEVRLSKIGQLKSALERIALRAISVEDAGVKISVALK
ncbi:MAG: hypothetical protein K2G11_09235 [Muribaculaceae bacterium]|nr:hypothetical protein [Muribaculaceae bacterium]